jgi:hypothetical protein
VSERLGLFSEGGKVQYLCPKCGSPNVARFQFGGQKAIACTPCNAWYQWKARIKMTASDASGGTVDG